MPKVGKDPNKGKTYNTAPAPTKVKSLHLMHHSMQFDDPPGQFLADLRVDLSKQPDIISIGEMNRFRDEIRTACKEYGYQPNMMAGVEEAILVRNREGLELKKYQATKILNQYGKVLQAPWHSNRYISWVRCLYYGQPVYYHTQHWVAHVAELPRVFLPEHAKQSKAMGVQMKTHGEGNSNAFFSGDLNWDTSYALFTTVTRPDIIFGNYNCVDSYTELGVGRPATFNDGRTLDYIGRYKRDTNVRATRFKVWDKAFSDHRALSTWYDIDLAVAQPIAIYGASGGDSDVTDGDTGVVDPDFYATGGNIDYSDYVDDTTYELVRVVEDSDHLRSG